MTRREYDSLEEREAVLAERLDWEAARLAEEEAPVRLGTLDAAWAAVVALLPEGYSLELHRGSWGAGYVRAEPPSRPGNRGPRLPRFTEGFGWPVDSMPTEAAALEALANQLRDER